MITLTHNTAARYLIGRTITSVAIEVIEYRTTKAYHVNRIRFDDGTSITLRVCEMESDYAVEACRHPAPKATP